jgi:hypothetical protein
MLLDMLVQIAQRAEGLEVVFVIGAKLKAVFFGYRERDLQNIDGIEAKSFTIERRCRVDLIWLDLQIQGRYDQLREFPLLGCSGFDLVHCLTFVFRGPRNYNRSATPDCRGETPEPIDASVPGDVTSAAARALVAC